MKIYFIVFASLLLTPLLGRELTIVKGQVETDDRKPAEFAIVTLLHAHDSSLLRGTVVDSTGEFILENIVPGNYVLAITLTGFNKYTEGPFSIAPGTEEYVVNTIVLTPLTEMKEVTITATQPLFIQKPDMLIMNVENSPVRLTGSVFELIQKVPGVTVNQNGSITMKGRTGVQVYIDGKPTYLAGDQLKQFLENLPATDVSHIEIISNPSSKYDAEGNSGIINIVTKKGAQQGFNGRVGAGVGYGEVLKDQFNVNLNYGKPKVNYYTRYNFSNWNNVDATNIWRSVPFNNTTTTFDQRSSSRNTPFTHSLTTGIDFRPNERTSYGFQLYGNLYTGTDDLINVTDIAINGQDSVYKLIQNNNISDRYQHGRAGVWMKHQFDTNGRELSAAADFLGYTNTTNGSYETHYYEPLGNEFGTPLIQRNVAASAIQIAVGQVDYTHPLNKKIKIDAGVKSSFVKTDNQLVFDVRNGTQWEQDTGRTNQFIYSEHINAGYAQMNGAFGNTEIQVGLRGEHTIADGNSPTTQQRLKRTYFQIFPTVFASHKINEKNSLNFSYARRINRPDYDNLNPFIYYLDQYTYQVGNPFLQPEITHNVELTHSFMDFIFTTVGTNRTSNAIMEVTDQNDSTGATFQTTTNLKASNNFWGNIGFGFPIGKHWIVENNIACYYMDFRSQLFGAELSNQSWMFNAFMQHSITLPYDFKLQVTGYYRSSMVYGMFKIKPQGGVDVGISKSFANKKWNVSLSVNDIFYTSVNRVNVDFQNQNVVLSNTNENRRGFLRVNYNFGNAKAARKSGYKSASEEIQQRAGKK